MSPEQLTILWQAVCKAHDNAHKHQWKEPYRSRWEEAQAAFDQAQAEADFVVEPLKYQETVGA